MKTFNSLLFVAVIALITGCDSTVKVYPSFTHVSDIVINDKGEYNEVDDVLVSEITDAISDLEAEGQILDIIIEGVFLDVTKNPSIDSPENTATGFNSSIFFNDLDDVQYLLIEDLEIDMSVLTQEIDLNSSLSDDGINKLRNAIYAIAIDDASFEEDNIGFRIMGTSIPADSYMNAELSLRIEIVVEYQSDL